MTCCVILIESMYEVNRNSEHNILDAWSALEQVRFATSKMVIDIEY